MKTLSPIFALACVGIAAAQTTQPSLTTSLNIAKPGTGGWKKSSMPLLDLAKKVDLALRSQRGAEARIVVVYDSPKGKGQSLDVVRIQDAKTFRVQFPNMEAKEPFHGEIRADGRLFSIAGPRSWTAPAPVPVAAVPPPPPQSVLRAWPVAFPRMMFSSLLLKSDTVSAFAQGLKQGVDGYATIIERRVRTYRGMKSDNYRIYAVRKGPAVKSFGPAIIELIVDAKDFLPLSGRSDVTRPKALKATRMAWQAVWTFGKKFDAKEFAIPGVKAF